MRTILVILIMTAMSWTAEAQRGPVRIVDVVTFECEALDQTQNLLVDYFVLESVIVETFGYSGRSDIKRENRLKTAPAVGQRIDKEGFHYRSNLTVEGDFINVSSNLVAQGALLSLVIQIHDAGNKTAQVTVASESGTLLMNGEDFSCEKTVEIR